MHLPWLAPLIEQHACSGLAGSFAPGSHDSLHAPVSLLSSGLKHGTQRSYALHVDVGSCESCDATWGMFTFKQRPSLSLSERHVVGTKLPPAAMKSSGTQRPVAHGASCDAIDGGTSAVPRQCAPLFGAPHAGSDDGSSTGGP